MTRVAASVGPRGLSLCVRGARGREPGPGRRLTPLWPEGVPDRGLGGAVAALRLRSVALWATLPPFYNRLELRVKGGLKMGVRDLRWPPELGLDIQGRLGGSRRVSAISAVAVECLPLFVLLILTEDGGIPILQVRKRRSHREVRIRTQSRAPSLWAEPLRSSGGLPP